MLQPESGNMAMALKPGARALVVDDNEGAREVLILAVGALGLKVDTAVDGDEALARIAERQGDYALVVCDMDMPGTGGEGVYAACQERFPQLCRRFMFITGGWYLVEDDTFLTTNGQPYLFKPFDMRQFRETSKALLAATASADTA